MFCDNDEYIWRISYVQWENNDVWSTYICKKHTPSKFISKLEDADIGEVFNINNEASVAHSLIDGEIAQMVLNQDDSDNSDEEDDIKTAEKKCLSTTSENVWRAYWRTKASKQSKKLWL